MKNIGLRVRSLRRLQKRTLREIASRCGFTVSLLSKIETGKTNPPVATLAKIASALGVGLGELTDPAQDKPTVCSPAAERTLENALPTDKGYTFHLLAARHPEKLMQPLIFEAQRGKITPGAMSHSGEEFVFVLEGRMHYRVGSIIYELGPGDGLYFNAQESHDLQPITDHVRYLAVFADRK